MQFLHHRSHCLEKPVCHGFSMISSGRIFTVPIPLLILPTVQSYHGIRIRRLLLRQIARLQERPDRLFQLL